MLSALCCEFDRYYELNSPVHGFFTSTSTGWKGKKAKYEKTSIRKTGPKHYTERQERNTKQNRPQPENLMKNSLSISYAT